MKLKFHDKGIYSSKNYNYFWKNGYIIIKNLLPKELCDLSNKYANQAAEKNYGQIMHLHREDFLVAQTSGKINKLKDLHEKIIFLKQLKQISSHYEDFLKNPYIVEYLNWLYSRKMTGLLTNIFFKKPKTKYAKQSWQIHQDNNYLNNKNGLYVTVNVAFNYMNQKNGGLKLYPGSHKLGQLKAKKKVSYRDKDGKPGNKIEIKLPMKPVAINLRKGDVLFMHGLCVHESTDNNSNDPRPLLSLGYIPYGEQFDPGYQSKRSVTFID